MFDVGLQESTTFSIFPHLFLASEPVSNPYYFRSGLASSLNARPLLTLFLDPPQFPWTSENPYLAPLNPGTSQETDKK